MICVLESEQVTVSESRSHSEQMEFVWKQYCNNYIKSIQVIMEHSFSDVYCNVEDVTLFELEV